MTINAVAFTHDTRGRVMEKNCGKTGIRWNYAYDSDNRLIEVTAISSSGSVVTRFGYDALGRRTTKFDGTNETLFVWDGLRLLREERGASATTYFYEQGGYTPLARVDGRNSFVQQGQGDAPPAGQENIYYYHCTPAGLPEDITDSEGRLIWRGRYSTWGKLIHEHTTNHAPHGFTQRMRMQGQYDDGGTGLYYNTFRYYDADAGRFSSEDPIGLMGDINVYNYPLNPLQYTDPLGLYNPEKCASIKKRINNLQDELYNKRYPDLESNPGNLPYKAWPGSALKDTVQGHEILVTITRRNLDNAWKEWYENGCDNPPPPPVPSPSISSEAAKETAKTVATMGGCALAVYIVYKAARAIAISLVATPVAGVGSLAIP